MSAFSTKARTAWALGPRNLLRVGTYRAGLRLGLGPVRRLQGQTPLGRYFRAPTERVPLPPSRAWTQEARYFGAESANVGQAPPDWHANPLSGARVAGADRDWWEIPDFASGVGDIKAVWEASRFDWVLAFAQQALAGDPQAVEQLQAWLADWCQRNPPFKGPNWKCGQEASIRVMHLATAAHMLTQVQDAEVALLDLVELHLRRIAPTMNYALAQDNNHGTSEAAALYIGGSWLVLTGREVGRPWQEAGRRWLEERVERLVMRDGSFSQYSVNYHRVMLDTLSVVEVWRQAHGLGPFSATFLDRARCAARWLRRLARSENGDAPNIGANDGARLLPLVDVDLRDHRPAVQLATVLFEQRRAYAEAGDWDVPLAWLKVSVDLPIAEHLESALDDDGGYAVLKLADAMAVVRFPRFRFRPSQADALHVDLWRGGDNLLRDAGTYGYNAGDEWQRYFSGTQGHNTVQFDGRDQMPRLGRFLFGDWLKVESLEPVTTSEHGVTFAAAYRDGRGARHGRRVVLHDGGLRVEDAVSGFERVAVLRWRLRPGDWRIEGDTVTDGRDRLRVSASVPFARFQLIVGWESRYYMQKSEVPVLEVELSRPGTCVSEYFWSP